ncbi:MAG: DNA replication/repair protein RecF [Flavobacteriaceae bacterium]|nr:DNA replication/repair protein RecF [Flavobacteriaceae bacterium]
MPIEKIKLTNLRNIEYTEINLANKFNLFYGENGSGKTSVLEAIHLLSTRKSFRTSSTNQIIKNSTQSFTIYAELSDVSNIGIEKKHSEPIMVKKNGESATVAETASRLPIQLINTTGFQLLDMGPKLRRKFIDWGVFHVEHAFFKVWQKFNNALANRNAILKKGGSREYLSAWNSILIDNAMLIDKYRKKYFEEFCPIFMEDIGELLDIPINLDYFRGWNEDRPYEKVINNNLMKDKMLGYTQYGPHKADLRITAYGEPVHTRLSRGQLKLVMCSLRLAQGRHLYKTTDKECLYLVDDVAAELDKNYLSRLVSQLNTMKAQVLVTGIENQHLEFFTRYGESRMFHVKHGKFFPENVS